MLTLFSLLSFTTASATVIDFEDIITSGQTTENDSTRTLNNFDVFVSHGHYEDVTLRGLGGTDYLLVDHIGAAANLGFDISANNVNTFSLNSIDVANWSSEIPIILTVTGQISGGDTISTNFTTDGIFGFETFSFSNSWVNLLSVNFTDFTGPNNTAFGQLVFDNIIVNETSSQIPEPPIFALLGLGLFTLGMMSWRRQA